MKVGEIAARRERQDQRVRSFRTVIGHYRRIAAPSELIRALKLQAEKRKIAFNQLEAESPVRCPTCGSLSRKTRADALPQVWRKLRFKLRSRRRGMRVVAIASPDRQNHTVRQSA